MAINSDEQQNAALSWTKALTKNKEIVAENSNRLIPKGSKLNLKNPPRIKRKLSAWKGRTAVSNTHLTLPTIYSV